MTSRSDPPSKRTSNSPQLNELACYVLAGAPQSPAELLEEVPAAEALGLGSAFISERFNIKEVVTLSGAVGAVSRSLGIATGATNHNIRHPLVTASYATTMHRLTGGRFTLGIGRGVELLFDAYGIPRITTAQMEDFVQLMRRLFRGELVIGHDGPAGKYPILHLDSTFDEDIPLGLVAFGPNSLSFAGRALDMVLLHTFFTDETTRRCVEIVRRAAEESGRDPSAVRVWSCYATIHDGLPESEQLRRTVGRLATYLQGYGDLLVRTNRWDPQVLADFRADELVKSFRGAFDAKADTQLLEHLATLLPEEWLEPAATGSAQRCAERVLHQFDLGVDGVIMHGSTPEQLAPVIEAYRAIRPQGRFDHLDPNPGRTH